MKNRAGQKRNMGFVGFRNEDDAANAIKLLHNTFVDTSKIHVEVAKAVCYCFYYFTKPGIYILLSQFLEI